MGSLNRIIVQVCPGIKARQILKRPKAKRIGGKALVVEHLPDKHKVLSSNPIWQKNKQTRSEVIKANCYPPKVETDREIEKITVHQSKNLCQNHC
jgi:hypothetical protein